MEIQSTTSSSNNRNDSQDSMNTGLEAKAASFLEYVSSKLNDAFEKNIPVDEIKEMEDTFWRRVFGVLACVIVLVVFIYFVATSYQNGVTSHFVSMDINGGDCDYVTRPLTATYLASTEGIWEGKLNFSYNLALYQFSFSNYENTAEQYTIDFETVYNDLIPHTASMNTSELAINLVFLQTALLPYLTGGSYQILTFTPSPGYIYNREYIYTAFSSKLQGNCPYAVGSTMDSPTAEMITLIDVEYYNILCNDTINWANLGWTSSIDGMDFTLLVDYRSAVTVIAVNMGFRRIDTLEIVELPAVIEADASFAYHNIIYVLRQYFDPSYPGMEPILCLFQEVSNELTFCMLRLDGTFLLPFSNSIGGPMAWDEGIPQYCNCSTEIGHSNECNYIGTLNSLLFSTNITELYWTNILPLMDMIDTYVAEYGGTLQQAYRHLNQQVYPYAFNTSLYYYGNTTLSFCPFDTCALITTTSYDTYSYSISEYYFQLRSGSCSNTVFTTSHWEILSQTPPATLVESYYTCVLNWNTALFNAFGISVGNASLSVQAFALLALPVIYIILKVNIIYIFN